MPSLSFKAPFAPAVQSGKKTHTIRNPRKTPIKVGDGEAAKSFLEAFE